MEWRSDRSVVSFTFDDFPRSAFTIGGPILAKHGVHGTFYASFGLCRAHTSVGEIFGPGDLRRILSAGHEIGCHTYDHLDAHKTKPGEFEQSIRKNLKAYERLFPELSMRTFSFPRSDPHPDIKAVAGRYFTASRGGGQTNNGRILDLNLIRSCFIDHKNRDDIGLFIDIIRRNAKEKRWLVFSTHDIGDTISPFGCHKDVFAEIVGKSVESGSLILPMFEVCSKVLRLS